MTAYRVRDTVFRDGPTLMPDTPMRRAVAILVKADAAAAAVLDDDGTMVGILTEKDCFRPTLHASYHREWRGVVSEYMSRDVVYVPADKELVAVAELFLEHPHRVFPVLEGERFIGLLHRSDVLKLLSQIA